MVPPRLPAGDYELTLRSRQPDGKQATSKQSVVVALAEVESSPGAVRSRAEVPFNVPETVVDKPFRAGSGRWVSSSAPVLPASVANCEAAGHCRFTTAARRLPPPPVRRRLTVHRGRAQDGDHGRIPWRQPLAHQPGHLRRGHAIRSRLQSEPEPNPKSRSYLSRPDLCPSDESALKSGGNSSACTRDGCARSLLALDHCAARHRHSDLPSLVAGRGAPRKADAPFEPRPAPENRVRNCPVLRTGPGSRCSTKQKRGRKTALQTRRTEETMNIDRRQLDLAGACHWTAGRRCPAFAASADEDAVAKNVEAFRAAQVAANAKALAALCAAELSYSHSDGRVEDKATFIANATNGKSKFLSLDYQDPKIRVVGPAAIVRFHWVSESRGRRRWQEKLHQSPHPDELAKAGRGLEAAVAGGNQALIVRLAMQLAQLPAQKRRAPAQRALGPILTTTLSRNGGAMRDYAAIVELAIGEASGRRARPRARCETAGLPARLKRWVAAKSR